MEDTDFTPRNVAKHVVTAIVKYKATQIARNTIVDHTQHEADEFIVKLGSGVVGWGVGAKLSPYTDKVVDKTADFVNAKREARKARKEDTTEKTEK